MTIKAIHKSSSEVALASIRCVRSPLDSHWRKTALEGGEGSKFRRFMLEECFSEKLNAGRENHDPV